MAAFKRCPNCGNEGNANIYRCNNCGKVFCSVCGRFSRSVFNWLTDRGKGKCPVCGGEKVTTLGSVGSGSLW